MKKPNILILFTDMQRADTIGALGNELIKTPALDRLVHEGTAFTRCYSPSPVCISARCSMQYGLYPQRTGLFVNGDMMDDNGESYPAQLSRAGYKTAAIGKCHFEPDPYAMRGFDERLVQEEILDDYDRDDYRAYLKEKGLNPCEPHGERGPMYYIPQVSRHAMADHPTQWIGNRTIEYIEKQESDKPWCLFASFIHPHPPLALPMPWNKLYRGSDMPPPLMPDHAGSLYTHINRKQNRYKWRDNGLDRNLLRCIRASYYGSVSFVDYQIGRIFQTLEKQGELDNTLIIFSSDHGEYLGDYGCYGKRSMHDASSRVPMLVRCPDRFAAGKVCSDPASLIDILPTVLGAAGTEAADADGLDLKQVADGNSSREYVYSQWGEGQQAIYLIVSKDWKYIYSAGDHKELMFDRIADPQETRNAANLIASESVKAILKNELLTYLHGQGAADAVELKGGQLDWKPYPKINQDFLKDDPDAGLLFQDEPESLFGGFPGYDRPSG